MATPLRVRAEPRPSLQRDGVEQLFTAIATHVTPEFTSLGRLATSGEVAETAIASAWDAARVVSFDIFDTLIVRKVAAPRDVFLHLATPAPFNGWGLDAVPLAQLRREAEHDSRARGVRERGSGEVTLCEIHEVLAERLGRSVNDVHAMVRAEQLVELALCTAHPHLQHAFTRAVNDGKTVWCVSDTYHDEAFLRELLEHCGYRLDGVLVVSSAECRMSKGEGALLKAVATEVDVPAQDVLHIGDHPQSDGSVPAAQGFVTVVHPWAASRPTDLPANTPGDTIALGLAQLGSRTVEPALPFWWRLGYAVAGPMLSGFAFWLHERFARDGIDRAYFLLRDGEIILDVYRELIGDRPGPSTALLESSRRAFVLPALASGRTSITSQLMSCENARPAREFLERFGLKAGDFNAAFRAVGLSPDFVVAPGDSASLTKVIALFGRLDVLNALLARSQTERRMLMTFLKQEGVLAPGRIALVDIGWNGTIQKALAAVGSVEKVPLDLHGYYLGTLPGITRDLGGSSASGFLFDNGSPAEYAKAVLQLLQLTEFICTTTRGSLRGFQTAGKTVVPVHGAVDHPESQRASVAQVREGALAYARTLAQEQRVFGEQSISAAAAIRQLARTIMDPTAEEAQHIGDIHHADGLGSDRMRALARFSDGAMTPESLLDDLARAYWPAGLLSRREPAAMALRTLLWMQSA